MHAWQVPKLYSLTKREGGQLWVQKEGPAALAWDGTFVMLPGAVKSTAWESAHQATPHLIQAFHSQDLISNQCGEVTDAPKAPGCAN